MFVLAYAFVVVSLKGTLSAYLQEQGEGSLDLAQKLGKLYAFICS